MQVNFYKNYYATDRGECFKIEDGKKIYLKLTEKGTVAISHYGKRKHHNIKKIIFENFGNPSIVEKFKKLDRYVLRKKDKTKGWSIDNIQPLTKQDLMNELRDTYKKPIPSVTKSIRASAEMVLLADEIYDLYFNKGFSYNELALRYGFHKSRISDFINGKTIVGKFFRANAITEEHKQIAKDFIKKKRIKVEKEMCPISTKDEVKIVRKYLKWLRKTTTSMELIEVIREEEKRLKP